MLLVARLLLVEVAALHLDRVDVKIGDVNVACPQAFGLAALIRGRRSMMEFVAAAMRQWESAIALSHARQFA